MNKREFLKQLRRELSSLPRSERDKALAYYDELISEKIENGVSEWSAVASMEDPHVIAAGIIDEAGERGVLAKKRGGFGKALITILCVLLGLALLAGAAGAVLVKVFGYRPGSSVEWTEMEESYSIDQGENIYIDLEYCDLLVSPSSSSRAELTYYECEDSHFTVEKAADGLHIKQTDDRRLVSFLKHEKKLLTVLVPAQFAGNLNIHCNAGEARFEDIKGAKEIDLSLTSGSMTVKGVGAKNVRISYTSGSVDITDIESEELLRINGITGKAVISGASAHVFELDITTGSMQLSGIVAEISRLTATTGSINFSDYDSQDITIDLTTGSVNGMLKGRLNDYEIDCGTLTGNCNLPSENNGGPRKLFGRCTTGRIHIYFENEERGQVTEVPDWF